MKHLKKLEAFFSDKVKDMFRDDVYYMNLDDYNYPDGYSRYFKRGDTVVLCENPGFTRFEVGDKFRILRMEGHNAKVIHLKTNKVEVITLTHLLKEEDFELSQATNKYNL